MTRGRSLSVGNDFKWRKNREVEECEMSKTENFRKHELIEIIRESMEKNRLCFQSKRYVGTINVKNTNLKINLPRKSHIDEKEGQSRPRSNTITCTKDTKPLNCGENDQHLCAFDSFLHSTICSNLNSFSKLETMKNNSLKVNSRNKFFHETPVLKLKTSVLNQLDQLDQNLTPEQKLSRKLNDVEKWLHERDNRHEIRHKPRENKTTAISPEGFHLRASSTPNKSFQDNAALKKNILHPPAPHHLKQHKEAINSTRNKAQCFANASDCENLLSMSEEETPLFLPKTASEEPPQEGSETASKSSSVRFVHIHHHFYHFENDGI